MSETSKADLRQGIYTESPLHYLHSVHSGDREHGLVVREFPLNGHLILRGDPDSETFRTAVKSVLGLMLPVEPCTFSSNDDAMLFWLGPDEWLAVVNETGVSHVEAELRDSLSGHFAIVDVSGGQTLVNLSGTGVETLLMKSSGYDFHPAHFAPGSCVQTTFAKTTALVARREDGSFDLVIRRSFADYLGRWLLDAGAEFGCYIG